MITKTRKGESTKRTAKKPASTPAAKAPRVRTGRTGKPQRSGGRAEKKARKSQLPKPLRLEWIPAGLLEAHPRNWRRHPEGQAKALKAVLDDPAVGWAGALLFNGRTGRLIDGHARKDAVAPKTPVPVLVGNWSEAAEAKLLLTLDPLAGMAAIDAAVMESLLADVDLAAPDLAGLEEYLKGQLADAKRANREATGTGDVPPAPAAKMIQCPQCGATFAG